MSDWTMVRYSIRHISDRKKRMDLGQPREFFNEDECLDWIKNYLTEHPLCDRWEKDPEDYLRHPIDQRPWIPIGPFYVVRHTYRLDLMTGYLKN